MKRKLILKTILAVGISIAGVGFGQWSSNVGSIWYGGGNVGIGTSGPREKLEVNGNILCGGNILFPDFAIGYIGFQNWYGNRDGDNLTIEAGNGQGSWNDENDNEIFARGGTINIKSGNGPTSGKVNIFTGSCDNGSTGEINIFSGHNNDFSTGDVKIYSGNSINDNSGSILIYPGNALTAGNIILAHNGTSSIGKVGIGTANPRARVEINSMNYSENLYLSMNNGTGEGAQITFEGSSNCSTWYQDVCSNSMRLFTGSDVENDVLIWNYGSGKANLMVKGSVGIGTTTPSKKLTVDGGDILVSGELGFNAIGKKAVLFLGDQYNGICAKHGTGLVLGVYSGASSGSIGNSTIDALTIAHTTGNVGIGTTSPSEKLCVNGTIKAKKIKVTTASNEWADFVFKKDYALMPLDTLESKINETGHLPGIPSDQEVAKNGHDIGDVQVKMLQKIEELTLYTIELNKKMKSMENQNTELKKRIEQLEK